jgi:uncharacterized membrane protein YagU involved in acid resistance
MSEDSGGARIRRYALPVLCGGLIAGTLDLGAACLINGRSPKIILQAIASGVLGKASFRMGMPAAALGLVLQWAMSILIAAIFAVGSSRLPIVRRSWVASGVAYGVVVYFVMNYVVVPLSAAGFVVKFSAVKFSENMLAMILFGLIIVYFGRDSAAPRATQPARSTA